MVKLNVCRVSRAAPGLRPRSAVTSDRCQTLPSCRRTALLPSNPPPPPAVESRGVRPDSRGPHPGCITDEQNGLDRASVSTSLKRTRSALNQNGGNASELQQLATVRTLPAGHGVCALHLRSTASHPGAPALTNVRLIFRYKTP